MPSASEFSTDPNLIDTIGGKSIAENQTATGDINFIIRDMAAAMRSTYDQLQNAGGGMPVTGGTFTGDILRQGRGAYLHHANSSRTGGMVDFLPEGSVRPTPVEGMIVFYYS